MNLCSSNVRSDASDGPTVSVIIPCLNRANVLPQGIQSVLAQTFREFEVIVIDDGSTDDIETAVKAFDDSRIRYIRHDRNRGVCAARNTGIRASRGRYIALLDSDDEWLPAKLMLQVRCIEEAPLRVGFVYTGFERIWHGKVTHRFIPTASGNVYQQQVRGNVMLGSGSTGLIRRECFKWVGLFDEDLRCSGDHDFLLRLARHYDVCSIPEVLARVHADGEDRLSNDWKAMEATLQTRIRKYRELLPRDDCRRVFPRYQYGLGVSALRRGDKTRARREFWAAIRARPFHTMTWVCLLLSLVRHRTFLRIYSLWRKLT